MINARAAENQLRRSTLQQNRLDLKDHPNFSAREVYTDSDTCNL
jgi:hypothetical protein